MIHYIKVRNFMSFKDEVCLDFEATDDKRLEDYHVVEMADGTRILRFSVLYGANASGKTNLINVFQFLFAFWNAKPNAQYIGAYPFLFDEQTCTEPSFFEMALYVEDTRYEYHLQMRGNTTEYEELFLCDNQEPTSVIRRDYKNRISELTFNPDVVTLSNAAIEAISLQCLPHMSIFAARNMVNVSIPHLDAVNDWITNNYIAPIVPEAESKLIDYWTQQVANNSNLHDYLIDFARKADFNIIGVKVNIEQRPIPDAFVQGIAQEQNLSENEKNNFLQQKISIINTEFTHSVTNKRGTEFYKLPIQFQSKGTLRALGLGSILYEKLKHNSFVAIDEIETSLHPELIEFFLKQFLEEEYNRSQMLITTHHANLLNTVDDILRRDNIWFIEKRKDGGSDLYSLVEFKGVDDMDHIQGAYINGCFGALPNLKM